MRMKCSNADVRSFKRKRRRSSEHGICRARSDYRESIEPKTIRAPVGKQPAAELRTEHQPYAGQAKIPKDFPYVQESAVVWAATFPHKTIYRL